MSEGVSITPGRFADGPERDAARRARSTFFRWLRESGDASAIEYRRWVEVERQARRNRARARSRARAAFKRLYSEGNLEGYAPTPTAPSAGFSEGSA